MPDPRYHDNPLAQAWRDLGRALEKHLAEHDPLRASIYAAETERDELRVRVQELEQALATERGRTRDLELKVADLEHSTKALREPAHQRRSEVAALQGQLAAATALLDYRTRERNEALERLAAIAAPIPRNRLADSLRPAGLIWEG